MATITTGRVVRLASTCVLGLALGCGGGSSDDDDATIDAPPGSIIDADPNAPDADPNAADASPSADPVPDRGLRLAYLATPTASPTPQVDVCMRRTEGDPWTRVYGGTAGIGHGQVGRYMPIDGLGAWRIEIIDATSDCGAGFLYGTNHVIDNDSVVKRTTLSYVLAGGVTAEYRYTRMAQADVTGSDVLAAMDGVDGAVAVRFDDGVAPQEGILGGGVVLTAGHTGNIEVDIEDAAGTQLFPYVAGDGVATTAFVTGEPDAAVILYCDELTPTAPPLGPCSPTLRAP